MRRRPATARGVATRALPALVVIGGCLTVAVAYAATAPEPSGAGAGSGGDQLSRRASSPGPTRLPRPSITRRPAKTSTSTTAGFFFKARRGAPRFQCRLDGGAWRRCEPPLTYRGLAPGEHSFSVRAVDRGGRRGAATRFRWTLFEPRPFSVEPALAGLGALYPGAPAQSLPVVLTNPNPASIRVISLRVAATADQPGCDSAANLELIPSSASPAAPLTVPAGGSVSLPGAGVSAPAIALRDLPVNQDACQGARFPLSFSGEAYG